MATNLLYYGNRHDVNYIAEAMRAVYGIHSKMNNVINFLYTTRLPLRNAHKVWTILTAYWQSDWPGMYIMVKIVFICAYCRHVMSLVAHL